MYSSSETLHADSGYICNIFKKEPGIIRSGNGQIQQFRALQRSCDSNTWVHKRHACCDSLGLCNAEATWRQLAQSTARGRSKARGAPRPRSRERRADKLPGHPAGAQAAQPRQSKAIHRSPIQHIPAGGQLSTMRL